MRPFHTDIRSSLRFALLASTLLSTQAFGQTIAAEAAPDDEITEIVVTGPRFQAVQEIEAKRQTEVISDSVSADEIGSLPDFGLGEALERVPGVSTVQNNDRGEAQFLSIRGLNADYNLVQIDGVTLPANELGRRNVSLDVIPSSLARRVDVYKSVTAALNPNAIGGIANLRTRSAFDRGGRRFIGGRFDIGKWENERVRHDTTPSGQAEIVFSDTFGPENRFGVVLSANYYRRDSASLNSATDNYRFFNPATGARLNVLTDDLSGANIAPERRRWLHYDNVRERQGVFGKLEYDNRQTLRLALTVADFTHTNDEERQSNIVVANGNPVASSITTNGGRVNSANAQVDLVEYDQERGIRYTDFQGRWTPDLRHVVDFGLNFAVATYVQDARLATYRRANTNNLGYNYELSPGAFAWFSFDKPDYLMNAANYTQFEYGTNRQDNREEAFSGRLDYSFNAQSHDLGFGFQAGAFLRQLERVYDYQVDNYRPVSGASFLLSDVDDAEAHFAAHNGRGQTMLFVDPRAAQSVFEANRSGFTENTANAANRLTSDYELNEDIHALYALGRYAMANLKLVAGLRYEKTKLETASYAARDGGYDWDRQARSYDDWLPSAQLTWDATARLRLKAAYGRTIGRPNYDDLAGRESWSTNDETGTITIRGGNPALKARRSDNLDLSLEYYHSRDVLFAVNLFRKDISNEIVTVRNPSTETIDGVEETVVRIRPANAGDAEIQGIELNAIVSKMDFLPAPLRGLGLSANVTWLDPTPPGITMSDDVTLRRLPGLFEAADTVANLKLFYKAGPVTVQGAWNYTSDVLYSVSTSDPLQDRVVKANTRMDAQIRYQVNPRVTLVAQGKNLTDTRRERMFGPDYSLLREELDNGRAFYVGAILR